MKFRSVLSFWRIIITGGKKFALKRNNYVKTIQRWCFDTISGSILKITYSFDKGLYIARIPRPVHAIIQWNNFRRQVVFNFINCFAMLSDKISQNGNIESNLFSVVKSALHKFRGFFRQTNSYSMSFIKICFHSSIKNIFDFRAKTVRGFAEAGFEKLRRTLWLYQVLSENERTSLLNLKAIGKTQV